MPFDNRSLAKRPRRGFDNRRRVLVPPTLAQQIATIMAGNIGVWFDASDLSTMYQDAAGTIPVTGVGQPVGLWLDKSLGSWLSTPVVVYSQSFGSGTDSWGGYQNTCTNDNGTLKTVGTVAGGTSAATKTITANVTSSGLYKYSAKVRADVSTVTQISLTSQDMGSPYTTLNNAQNVIFSDSNQWKTLATYVYVNNPAAGVQIGVQAAVTVSGQLPTFWIEDVVVAKVHPSANHAFQTTATKRPILSQDADGKYCLQADGVDDGFVTAVIPWIGNNATLACAYNCFNSSVDAGLFETSISSYKNPGAMLIMDASAGISGRLGSTTYSLASSTTARAANQKRVYGIWSNGSVLTLHLANTNYSTTTTNVGTLQPYSSSIMFRPNNGAPLAFLNGFMYGLIALNSAYSDANRILIEQYLAQQAGVTLP
jgi:hypothetical protein